MASDDLSATLSSSTGRDIVLPGGVRKFWELGKRQNVVRLAAWLDANGFEGYIRTTAVTDASSEAQLAGFRRLIDDSWSGGPKSRNLLGEMLSDEAADAEDEIRFWMVKRILAMGANPSVHHGGFEGRSVLSVAIELGQWQIAKALLVCLSGAEIERLNPAVGALLETLNEKERTANKDHPTIAELAHDKTLFFAARNRCIRRVVDCVEAVRMYKRKDAIEWTKRHERAPLTQEMRYLLLGEVTVSPTGLLGEVTVPSIAISPDAAPDGNAPFLVNDCQQHKDRPNFPRGNEPVYEDRDFLLHLKQCPHALQFPSHLLTNANSQPIWKLTPDSASEVFITKHARFGSGKAIVKFDFMPLFLVADGTAVRLSDPVVNPQNGMADGPTPEKSSSSAMNRLSSMPKKVDEVLLKPQPQSDTLTLRSPAAELVFQYVQGVEEKVSDVSMKIRPDLGSLRRTDVQTERLGRYHLASEMYLSHELHRSGTAKFGTALENVPPRPGRFEGHAGESGPLGGPNSLIIDDGTTRAGGPIQMATLELLKGLAGIAATDPSLELLEDVIRILRKHKKS